MKKLFLLFFLLTIISFNTQLLAIIRLPPIMSSNMVLQQNSQATLWGWADPSERFTITCSWKTTVDSVIAFNSGKWKARIATPSAGGPYTITIKGRLNTIVLENILIGEVWVCSGQSNMEMSNTQQIRDELPNCKIATRCIPDGAANAHVGDDDDSLDERDVAAPHDARTSRFARICRC